MNNFCVLIPSYNEAKTIGAIVKDVMSRGLSAYVIDDGSTDETSENARKEGAVVIRLDINMGKGGALREGFRYIANKGFDGVIIIDGDGQHEVASIPDFIKKIPLTLRAGNLYILGQMGD